MSEGVPNQTQRELYTKLTHYVPLLRPAFRENTNPNHTKEHYATFPTYTQQTQANRAWSPHGVTAPPYDIPERDDSGCEYDENARVWRIYKREAESFDQEMIEGWKGTVDVLLVFSALFSAVLTAFLIDSYKSLKANPTDTTNAILNEILRSISNSTQAFPESIPKYHVSTTDVWINGLWFGSLISSLAAALVCVLVKQWIIEYMSGFSALGSFHDQAVLRQYRYDGIPKWYLPQILSALPLLLHFSLLLYTVGLAIFLLQLNITIAVIAFTMLGIIYTFYLGTAIASAIFADCPFKSPISQGLCRLLHPMSYRDREATETQKFNDPLSSRCLSWLFEVSKREDVKQSAAAALWGLPFDPLTCQPHLPVKNPGGTIQDSLLRCIRRHFQKPDPAIGAYLVAGQLHVPWDSQHRQFLSRSFSWESTEFEEHSGIAIAFGCTLSPNWLAHRHIPPWVEPNLIKAIQSAMSSDSCPSRWLFLLLRRVHIDAQKVFDRNIKLSHPWLQSWVENWLSLLDSPGVRQQNVESAESQFLIPMTLCTLLAVCFQPDRNFSPQSDSFTLDSAARRVLECIASLDARFPCVTLLKYNTLHHFLSVQDYLLQNGHDEVCGKMETILAHLRGVLDSPEIRFTRTAASTIGQHLQKVSPGHACHQWQRLFPGISQPRFLTSDDKQQVFNLILSMIRLEGKGVDQVGWPVWYRYEDILVFAASRCGNEDGGHDLFSAMRSSAESWLAANPQGSHVLDSKEHTRSARRLLDTLEQSRSQLTAAPLNLPRFGLSVSRWSNRAGRGEASQHAV